MFKRVKLVYFLFLAPSLLKPFVSIMCTASAGQETTHPSLESQQTLTDFGQADKSINVVCPVKKDLLFNLEQLAWFVKGDCLGDSVKALARGCPCIDAGIDPCANECWLQMICCPAAVNATIAALERWNAEYANYTHSRHTCT